MRDLFVEIWESVRRNKLRTCLTGLAVSWGIFMLIVLLGAGNGLMNAFLFSGDDFPTNTMMVGGGRTGKPYGGYQQGRRIRLEEKDMDILKSGYFADKVDRISVSSFSSGYVMSYGKHRFNSVELTGTMPGDCEMNGVEMLAGRFINENDLKEGRKVAVIPHLTAKQFLGDRTDYERLLGKRVKIGSMSFLIIGVRRAAENEDDRSVQVPYSTVKTLFNKGNYVDQLTFSFHGIDSEAESEEFEKHLKASLNTAHQAAPDDESAIWVWNRFEQNLQINKGAGIIRTALWIIGLLTLLSGIVGVSNIMLITVKERTHEFGIRKAIGAKPWNVTSLILAESITITAVFGYIGMILGLVACEILDATVGHSTMMVFNESIQILKDPTVGVGTAVGATIVLIAAGTAAGLFPARKAARVKPIEALRAN